MALLSLLLTHCLLHLLRNCRALFINNPIKQICAAPATSGKPIFKEDTQYTFNYQTPDQIEGYSEIDEMLDEWPTLHNWAGFTASQVYHISINKYLSQIVILSTKILCRFQ